MHAKSVLNESVLLLNVNFEPLNVCNTRRALSLLYLGKAEIIINGRGYIQTHLRTFELPSVIRLNYMVKRPRARIALSKREILRRDNFTCQYCGKRTSLLTIDHIKPRHAGGPHSWTNLVAACQNCNRRKGGKMLANSNMKLLRPPKEPPASAEYRFGNHLNKHAEWRPFIEGW